MNEPTVRVLFNLEDSSDTKSCEIEKGSLISQAAYKAGVTLQMTCGGVPSCTDCRVIVRNPQNDPVEPMEGPETRLMGNVYFISRERLSCQTRIKNDLEVFVPKFKRKSSKKEIRKYGSNPKKENGKNPKENEKKTG